jgi:hypothetical protein
MLKKALCGLDVHDVALAAAVHEADDIAKGQFLYGITTEEVGGIVGFGTEPEKGSGPTGQPLAPCTEDTMGCSGF